MEPRPILRLCRILSRGPSTVHSAKTGLGSATFAQTSLLFVFSRVGWDIA